MLAQIRRRLLALPLPFSRSIAALPLAASLHTQPTRSSAMTDASKTLDIQIVSDNICPFCYLGKKKVEAAVAQLPKDVKVHIEWRPFQLDPMLPAPGVNKLVRYATKFGGQERVNGMLENMKAHGAKWGINFSFGGNIGNTVDSHRLVEFSKQPAQGGGAHTDALINALFKRYFEEEQDLSTPDVLVSAAREAGLPASEEELRTFLRSDQLRKEVLGDMASAAEAGISGVPHFIVNGQYAISGAQEPDTFLAVFKKAGVAV